MNEDSRRIALQRVQILFQLAEEVVNEEPDLAQRYVEIARKIAMRTRIHIPREYRLLICRHCKRFIVPGVNSRVRLQSRREPHVVVTCMHCGGHVRVPLEVEKST